MFLARALRFSAPSLLMGALIATSTAPAVAQDAKRDPVQDPPMEITTDTPEYCQELLHRIGDLVRLASAPVPQEVTDLTSEGRRMCGHGQTRSGIARARSALMMMEKGNGTATR
jgi:hypothetical protein